jgi:hypothetical protein
MVVDLGAREIRLLAILQPKAFGPGWFKQLPGHHAVTWKEGRKGDEALLATFTSDTEVYDALVSLGAKPGNNLTQVVWDERNNPKSSAPSTRVEGDPVVALVWWKGLKEPLPLSALLNNPTGKKIDLRFEGKSLSYPSGNQVASSACKVARAERSAITTPQSRLCGWKATFTVNKAVVPSRERRAVVILKPVDGKETHNLHDKPSLSRNVVIIRQSPARILPQIEVKPTENARERSTNFVSLTLQGSA